MPTVHVKDKLVFRINALIAKGNSKYEKYQSFIKDAVEEKLGREEG